ncbi:hypothetical protein TNIN_434511 [Trichonephila inaurata madagascariensis]|uniref:Uncharacterized protein n=1 Tax=Trichonephila inaurata madagascariensis TaxID=2747483 RepID=A0A8X6IBP3_9ARAC|nr:hypothetical protein TNIN_434511 [Trichonephila inaurata madagascariensis]
MTDDKLATERLECLKTFERKKGHWTKSSVASLTNRNDDLLPYLFIPHIKMFEKERGLLQNKWKSWSKKKSAVEASRPNLN